MNTLSQDQWIVLTILCVTIVLWVTEVIPLYVTSILSSVLLFLFYDTRFLVIFSPYVDPVIILFLGGFVLALALQRYGLDSIIAHKVLGYFSKTANSFLLGLMLITAFLSMWMSNTAAAAVMISIAIAVLKQNNVFNKDSGFTKSVLLAVAYSASIGGIATLIGSPPNAIAARFLADINIELGFNEWLMKTLPFVLVSLLLVWYLLTRQFKNEKLALKLKPSEGSLSGKQIAVLGVFILSLIGWMTGGLTGLSSAKIAIIPIVLFLVFGLLKIGEFRKISWGTLLLFGGGLSLGSAVTAVGLDIWITNSMMPYFVELPQFLLVLILVFFGIFVTMLASNTASAVILIPSLLPLSTQLGIDTKALAILVGISVSLDFMMPVGTPPNAVAYSTGFIKIREMMKVGMWINLATGLLLSALFYFFYL